MQLRSITWDLWTAAVLKNRLTECKVLDIDEFYKPALINQTSGFSKEKPVGFTQSIYSITF